MSSQSIRREVLQVAIPAIGEAYLQNVVGVVDMLFISKIGLTAVDAVGVTNVFAMTYIGVFTALGSAAAIFMSRAKGAQDDRQVWRSFVHGMVLATLVGVLIGALSVMLRVPLLQSMGAQSDIFQESLSYFSIVIGASPLIAWFTSLGASFRSLADTRTPFRIGLEMNALHIVFDYLLIFGLGSWHGWGITGAALATVLARLYGVLRMLVRLRKTEIMRGNERFAISGSLLWQMARLAVPAAGERLFMRLGQVLYFGMIVRMGVAVYAAHNIAGSITTFSYTIGTGFAVAATALIGRSIGEGNIDKANEYRRWTYRYAAVAMVGAGALLFVTSPWLGLAFTTNHQVIGLLTIVLGIDILSQPFLASVLVDTSAIQVGGNTTYPMIVTAVGMWGVRTLGVYLFGVVAGWGLPAVWGSIALDNALRCYLFFRYRKKGDWVKAIAKA